LTAKPVVFWAGQWSGYVPRKPSSKSLIWRQKQSGTTVMVLMRISGSGITSADMQFRRVRQIPIRLKPIMPNSVIIWLALLANRVVFLGVRMRLNVRSAYLCSPSTAGNFTSNVSQIMSLMLWTLLAHDV